MAKNILLVDKDKNTIKENAAFLADKGYEVKAVATAQEAIDSVSKSKPDAVVTEIMLEHVDSGFSLCYHLKKSHPDMTVIILSDIIRKSGIEFGVSTHEQREWIKADEFIEKPVKPETLECHISRHFE